MPRQQRVRRRGQKWSVGAIDSWRPNKGGGVQETAHVGVRHEDGTHRRSALPQRGLTSWMRCALRVVRHVQCICRHRIFTSLQDRSVVSKHLAQFARRLVQRWPTACVMQLQAPMACAFCRSQWRSVEPTRVVENLQHVVVQNDTVGRSSGNSSSQTHGVPLI
jgi:hypothetical protein